MRNPVPIEDIAEMRQREGIDDIELRVGIRSLKAGQFVRLTLLGPKSSETVLVRITSVKGVAFRGKLANMPRVAGLSHLRTDTPLAFTSDHIHSLPNGKPMRDFSCAGHHPHPSAPQAPGTLVFEQ